MKSVQYSSLLTSERDEDDIPLSSTIPLHQSLEIDVYNEEGDDNDDEYDSSDDEESPNSRTATIQKAAVPAAPHFQEVVKKSPPSSYICPLTLRIIKEPVSDECGHTFEKDAIYNWLEIHDNQDCGGGFCPISRKPLCKEELYPNIGLKNRIQQWKSIHSQQHNNGAHHDHSSSSNGSDETATTSTTTTADNYYYDDEDCFVGVENNNNNSNGTYSSTTTRCRIELLLLPQERHVLQMIQHRAFDLRRIRRKKVCLISIAVSVVCISLVAGLLVLKIWRDGVVF